MSWPEILEILEGELGHCEDSPERLKSLRNWKQYESREAAIDAAKFDESTHRKIAQQACVQFSETRTWPEVTQDQLFWIYARLSVARDLVKFFQVCKRSRGWVFPYSEEGVPERSVLETLLVQYWFFQGKAAFLGSIFFDQMGPFDPLAELPEPPGFP